MEQFVKSESPPTVATPPVENIPKEPKMSNTAHVHIVDTSNDTNVLEMDVEYEDHSNLLIVNTSEGSSVTRMPLGDGVPVNVYVGAASVDWPETPPAILEVLEVEDVDLKEERKAKK